MEKFIFENQLEEGLILSRPNRFIMFVKLGNRTVKCHCPATGRIGDIVFKDVPCLVSRSNNPERKTGFTVEAISLEEIQKKNKKWIGINQTRANDYVDFFFRQGGMPKIVGGGKIEREVRLGKSRIDFHSGKTYVEVKMPLITMPMKKGELRERQVRKFTSFDRLIRHFGDLAKSMHKGSRAVLLMCYMYDAEPFSPPKPDKSSRKIQDAARRASAKGVENWQVNLEIDKKGVTLKRYFRLKMFGK